MSYIDDYIANLKKAKSAPITTAYNQAMADLDNTQKQTEQERNDTLPQYGQAMANEDNAEWQREQELAQRAAATGNNTSDQLNSNVVSLKNALLNSKSNIDNNREKFKRDIMNRLAQVDQNRKLRKQEYDNGMASLEAEAQMQRLQMEQQERDRARASGGGGGNRPPTEAELKRMGYSGAYYRINEMIANGDSIDRIRKGVIADAANLASVGVDVNEVLDYLNMRYRNWGDSYSESPAYRDAAYSGQRGMGGFVPE